MERDHPPVAGQGVGRVRAVGHRSRRSNWAQWLLPVGAPLGEPVADPARRVLGGAGRRADRTGARHVAPVRARRRTDRRLPAQPAAARLLQPLDHLVRHRRHLQGLAAVPRRVPADRAVGGGGSRRASAPNGSTPRSCSAPRAGTCCGSRSSRRCSPICFTGLRLAVGFAWTTIVAAETVERHPRHRRPGVGDQEGVPQPTSACCA